MFPAKIRISSRDIMVPQARQVSQGRPCLFLSTLISRGTLRQEPSFHRQSLRRTDSWTSGQRSLRQTTSFYMSQIVLPTACALTRHARVAICEILFHEAIGSINRSICCIALTAVIFLSEAAATIQFYDMILAKETRVFLSRPNPVVLMAPLEWHSVTTVSCMSPVAIQKRSSVTIPRTGDHPASHSSKTWQTIPSF